MIKPDKKICTVLKIDKNKYINFNDLDAFVSQLYK